MHLRGLRSWKGSGYLLCNKDTDPASLQHPLVLGTVHVLGSPLCLDRKGEGDTHIVHQPPTLSHSLLTVTLGESRCYYLPIRQMRKLRPRAAKSLNKQPLKRARIRPQVTLPTPSHAPGTFDRVIFFTFPPSAFQHWTEVGKGNRQTIKLVASCVLPQGATTPRSQGCPMGSTASSGLT